MKKLLILFSVLLPAALFANNLLPIATVYVDGSLSDVVYQNKTYLFKATGSFDPDGGSILNYERRWGSTTGPLASTNASFGYTFTGTIGLPDGLAEKSIIVFCV